MSFKISDLFEAKEILNKKLLECKSDYVIDISNDFFHFYNRNKNRLVLTSNINPDEKKALGFSVGVILKETPIAYSSFLYNNDLIEIAVMYVLPEFSGKYLNFLTVLVVLQTVIKKQNVKFVGAILSNLQEEKYFNIKFRNFLVEKANFYSIDWNGLIVSEKYTGPVIRNYNMYDDDILHNEHVEYIQKYLDKRNKMNINWDIIFPVFETDYPLLEKTIKQTFCQKINQTTDQTLLDKITLMHANKGENYEKLEKIVLNIISSGKSIDGRIVKKNWKFMRDKTVKEIIKENDEGSEEWWWKDIIYALDKRNFKDRLDIELAFSDLYLSDYGVGYYDFEKTTEWLNAFCTAVLNDQPLPEFIPEY